VRWCEPLAFRHPQKLVFISQHLGGIEGER
jgi:hypothetical protein